VRLSWPEYAMELAKVAALRSEDQHTKVGAAILRANMTVLSAGYNGAPSGVQLDWSDRESRRRFVIHAEQNALRYATPETAAGGLIAVSHHPCDQCVRLIASYGVREVYWDTPLDWQVYDKKDIEQVALTCGVNLRRLTHEQQR